MKKENKKRTLKKGVENVCISIVSIYFTYVMFTIETLNNSFSQIITYIASLVIGGIITIPCLYLLIKYSSLFDEE